MRFLKQPPHGAILWFFKESHLRKLWPSYDCYFEFGKSSEVQSKSQMRMRTFMNAKCCPKSNSEEIPLKFFLTAFENEAQCLSADQPLRNRDSLSIIGVI